VFRNVSERFRNVKGRISARLIAEATGMSGPEPAGFRGTTEVRTARALVTPLADMTRMNKGFSHGNAGANGRGSTRTCDPGIMSRCGRDPDARRQH
jgi:hypothetical protein